MFIHLQFPTWISIIGRLHERKSEAITEKENSSLDAIQQIRFGNFTIHEKRVVDRPRGLLETCLLIGSSTRFIPAHWNLTHKQREERVALVKRRKNWFKKGVHRVCKADQALGSLCRQRIRMDITGAAHYARIAAPFADQ